MIALFNYIMYKMYQFMIKCLGMALLLVGPTYRKKKLHVYTDGLVKQVLQLHILYNNYSK